MSLPIGQLTGVIDFAYFCWLDIVGDQVRATTRPGGYTFGASETGDPDLDGHTFTYVPAELVNVGDANHSQTGSDTLEITLTGIAGASDTLLATLAVRANWQGRIGRLWHAVTIGGSIVSQAGYYTGYMMSAPLRGSPSDGGSITLTLENYLSLLTTPRSRSYQDQGEHDPGDGAPARIRAAANGATSTGLSAVGGGGSPSGPATGSYGSARNLY